MTTTCPACLLRPSRPRGVYCFSCIRADDMVPNDPDWMLALNGRLVTTLRDRGVVRDRLERRGRLLTEGAMAMEMAARLLDGLAGPDSVVWTMFLNGDSERSIAASLGMTREALYSTYLRRLRLMAGLPARAAWRPHRARSHTKAS